VGYRATVRRSSGVGRFIRRTVFGAVLVALLVGGGTAFRVWQVARADDRRPVDMVVVLGAAQYDGTPSDVLAARLEQALELYQEHLSPYIVTVGGKEPGDAFTEAQAGKAWLEHNGVPASRVVNVDEGRDTLRSVQAVAHVAEQRGWHTALIVSDPWHSLRAMTMADDSGLQTYSSPTRSGPIVQTRSIQWDYIVRETGALLFYRLTHAPPEFTAASLD
jgi:uncharacterized SAM-binding protein YcdF (DUF218 family)